MTRLARLSRFFLVGSILLASSDACLASGYFTSGPLPNDLRERLDTLANNGVPIEGVCFDGAQSWVTLTPNEIRSGGPLPQRMVNYIEGLKSNGRLPRAVQFSGDGWYVLDEHGGLKIEGHPLPPDADEFIQGALNGGSRLQSVSCNRNGWVVVTDRAVKTGGAVPPNLLAKIQEFSQRRIGIRSISLAPNGIWVITTK
ncbi:hypothetical protein [Paludisphaera rhizosphaerae]|uniref:hypothetical protein n=1 Tax=Paludisphaera rhizosphaerae TaxID=2711216 RepID=UPI0013EC2DCA|nr:hypothetical protein [Paludisphaera rhizosphaerae]